MIIYGSSLSPYVRKTLILASELDVEVRNSMVPPGSDDAEFREASPFGKIPAMRDGDFTLCDSSAIAAYLDARHPEKSLIPSAPRERARVVWFDEFGDTILFGVGAKIFFNRIVAPFFQNMEGDLALAEKAEREELPPILDYLEGVIPPSGFLVENRLTLADIAVASPLVNLLHLGLAPDAADYPNIAKFAEAIFARPSVAPLIAKEQAFLARFASREGAPAR